MGGVVPRRNPADRPALPSQTEAASGDGLDPDVLAACASGEPAVCALPAVALSPLAAPAPADLPAHPRCTRASDARSARAGGGVDSADHRHPRADEGGG